MLAIFFNNVSTMWVLAHILVMFLMVFRSRYSWRKTILLTCILVGPLVIFNVVIVLLHGVARIERLFMLTCVLPGLIFFYLISEDRTIRFLFTFCLANTGGYWISIFTRLLDYYLGGGQGILMFAGRLVLFPLTEWCVYRWLRRPYFELQKCVTKGWWLFAVTAVLYYQLLYVLNTWPSPITERPQEIPVLLWVMVLIPCAYGTIFSSLYRQLLLYRRQQDDRVLLEQKHQLEAQLQNQQRIRQLRHDMKGNVVTLSGLLAAGKVGEAQEFLKAIGEGIDATQNQFCGNPYLDSVFSHYDHKYREMGIPLQLDIQVGEEALPSEDLLCQILTNGLENAYEALCVLSEEEREASVRMRYKRDYLLIRIRNRCDSGLQVEKGELPHTTKGGMDHGLGLLTVQDYARRMGGELLCYTEEGFFLMDVMVKVRFSD